MLIDFYATYVLLRHPFLYYLLRNYYAVFLYCLVLDVVVSCLDSELRFWIVHYCSCTRSD